MVEWNLRWVRPGVETRAVGERRWGRRRRSTRQERRRRVEERRERFR